MKVIFFLIAACAAGLSHADLVTLVMENRITELKLDKTPTSLVDFADSLGRYRDGRLDWFRVSRKIEQEAQLLACREQVSDMRIARLSPADWIGNDHLSHRTKLIELIDSLEATGRVTEYGRLDAMRLKTDDSLNRRLRHGDMIRVRTDELREIFVWNVRDGFVAKPYASNKFAYRYAGYTLADRVVRGDYAYSISPDGEVRLLGIGTHNQSNRVLEPGTLLFFPPPGFGRSEQTVFGCIAKVLSYQNIDRFKSTRQWRD